MQNFLAREDTFQQQMLASLRDDPTYAPYATTEIVVRNRHLLMFGLPFFMFCRFRPVKKNSSVPKDLMV